MQRRKFMRNAGTASAALTVGALPGFTKNNSIYQPFSNQRDRYGGLKDIKFEPNGFFRLEKADRWWLVTPEGHAYLSFGLNHAERKHLYRGYNKDHWIKEFGLKKNAEEKDLQPGFENKVKKDMDTFGTTTLGTHSSTREFSEIFTNDVVNVRMVNICHYQTPTEDDFLDVFSENFKDHCEERAQEVVVPRKDDPRVLGYTLTDCPIFTEPESWPHEYNIYGWKRDQVPTWPRVLRNKGPESPGKKAYVNTMKQIYNHNIADFNDTYNTDFISFDALLQAENWRRRPELDNVRESRDNDTFLLRVIDKCYEVEVGAIRKYDTNHMVFGDKFQGNRMGLEIPLEHISLFAKHFDLIFFQKYATWYDMEPLMDLFRRYGGGKPCYVGDGSLNVPNENMPDPFGPHCATQKIRAQKVKELLYNSFARFDMVGWDWCGWMDLWVKDPDNLQARDPRHGGVQDPFGNYNTEMVAVMKEFSEKIYEVGTGSFQRD